MILEQEYVETESIGFTSSKKAFISSENLGFVLNALSKNFYSNPVESVVREYCNNAYDAEIQAFIEKPVVKLKYDRGDRSIHFIDHGVGLTPDMMERVFISFGESTKRESQSYIGSMGFGCKSAFALVDSFYINTRVDGIEYQYMFSKVGMIPELDELARFPTNEPNGTEVWFYLKPSISQYSDTEKEKFEAAIKRQLKYFDSVLVEGFNVEDEYTLYKGKHFICRPDLDNVGGTIEICFGKNVYPIDWNALGINAICSNIALYFEIGELQVVPNREQLLWTDTVKKRVLEKIKLVKDELQALYTATASETDDLFYYLNNRNSAATIGFGKYQVDVSGFNIENKLTYTGIKGLHLHIPSDAFIDKLFSEFGLENNKSNNRWGYYSNIYKYPSRFWVTEKNPTKAKTSYIHQKQGWKHWGNLTWMGEESLVDNYQFIKYFYNKDVLDFQYNSTTREWTEINPTGIDYVTELRTLLSKVKETVFAACNDYDSIVLPKKAPASRRTKLNEEIGVSINGGKRTYMYLHQLKRRAANIFLCDTEGEVNTLCWILADYNDLGAKGNKKGKYRYDYVTAVINTPKKYQKQVLELPNVRTYEAFFSSTLYKRIIRNNEVIKLYREANVDSKVLQELKPVLHKLWMKFTTRNERTIPAYILETYPVQVYPKVLDKLIVSASIRYKKLYQEYQRVQKHTYTASYVYTNQLELQLHILKKQLAKCNK